MKKVDGIYEKRTDFWEYYWMLVTTTQENPIRKIKVRGYEQ